MINISKCFNKNVSQEVKASFAYTICGLLVKSLSVITLPLFTRIMTTAEFGVSTVYGSALAIVSILVSLQLPYGSLSTAMVKFKNDRFGYISTICSITTVMALGYIALCFVFRDFAIDLLDIPFILIVLMGVQVWLDTAITAWLGQQRFEYKYKAVVLVTLLISIVTTFASFVAVINSSNKGVARVIASIMVYSVFGIAIFIFVMFKGKKPFDLRYWKYALSFNVPLIPYYLSQVVFNQSDRLMINKMCGRDEAAKYGVAYSMATILLFVINSIHSSYTPWFFQKIDKGEVGDNRNVTIVLSIFVAFILLGIISLAPEILYVMAGQNYADAVWVVPPVAISLLLLYYADLFDCILFFYESKFFLSIAAVVSAFVNVVLNYFFIPRLGYIAAGYTTMFSYCFLAFIDYIYMKILCEKKGISIQKIYNIKALMVILVIFVALGFTAISLYEKALIRYSIIIIGLLLILGYRKKIISIYRLLKS